MVYLAEPVGGGAPVAVKALRPELTVALGAGRFQREVEILGRLRHPGIVPVLESGAAGSLLYLVMPYVAGQNLRTRLEQVGPSRSPRRWPSRPTWPRLSTTPMASGSFTAT